MENININRLAQMAYNAHKLQGGRKNSTSGNKGIDDDEGIIMRPCVDKRCGALVPWDVGNQGVRKCPNCGYLYDDDTEINYFHGYKKNGGENGQKEIQTGDPKSIFGPKNAPDFLYVGDYGKDAKRLKQAQMYSRKVEHVSTLKKRYRNLLYDTLAAFKYNVPDALLNEVLVDFDKWYEVKQHRHTVIDTIITLAGFLYDRVTLSNSAGALNISKDILIEKMKAIYFDKYAVAKKKDKNKEKNMDSNNDDDPNNKQKESISKRISKITKDSRRNAVSQKDLKESKNMASVVSISMHQKTFIKDNMKPFGVEHYKTLDDLNNTFEDIRKDAGAVLRKATSKTTDPIILAVTQRRHGFMIKYKDLKETSRKHLKPLLESSLHLPIFGGKSCSSQPLNKFLQINKYANNDDDLFEYLSIYDDIIANNAKYISRAALHIFFKTQKQNLGTQMSSMSPSKVHDTIDAMHYGSVNDTKLKQIEHLLDIILQTNIKDQIRACLPIIYRESWAKLFDSGLIELLFDEYKIIDFSKKITVKNYMQMVSVVFDIVAYIKMLTLKHIDKSQILSNIEHIGVTGNHDALFELSDVLKYKKVKK